jgi:DNA-binding CsgD family transcriptional regulator
MGLSLTTIDAARLRSASEVLLSRSRFADHPSWCVEALRRLEELFQADRSLFILPSREGVHVVSESIPDPMFGQFREAFAGMSEGRLVSDREDVDAVLEARRAMGMDVFTNDALLQSTAGSPESVPWYHDVILPSGVRYGSGVVVSLPVGGAWLCVAHSRPDADPFGTEAGLDLLRILLPSFRAGVEMALSMEDGFSVGEANDRGSTFALFDGAGRELFRSRELVRILSLEDTPTPVEEAMRALARQVEGLMRRPSGKGASFPLPACQGEVVTPRGLYLLSAALLDDDAPPGEASVSVAVTPPFPDLPSVEELMARHPLTRREAQVTLLLASGASNVAASTALGISPHTVRTHAERIFRKLGIRTRKGLGLRLVSDR